MVDSGRRSVDPPDRVQHTPVRRQSSRRQLDATNHAVGGKLDPGRVDGRLVLPGERFGRRDRVDRVRGKDARLRGAARDHDRGFEGRFEHFVNDASNVTARREDVPGSGRTECIPSAGGPEAPPRTGELRAVARRIDLDRMSLERAIRGVEEFLVPKGEVPYPSDARRWLAIVATAVVVVLSRTVRGRSKIAERNVCRHGRVWDRDPI